MPNNPLKIVLIGGGTGSFTLLQELKEVTPNITAVVNMSDDGGSTGVLRDELGVLPPGDVRQCLVALSSLADVRDIFTHRFNSGALAGHSLGNIILSGLEQHYDGDFEKAIEVASRMLDVTGQVVPVTLQEHRLVMRDGEEVVRGQYIIEKRKIDHYDTQIGHEPEVHINPRASEAIDQADLIVIAPGNLYSSILPALAVQGVKSALQNARAQKVMVSNLVNKPGQTDNWHVADYVTEIEKYIGEGQIDYTLYNNQPPSAHLLSKYAQEGEYPVGAEPKRFSEINARAIGAPLVSSKVYRQDSSDKFIQRTLIRHDAKKVRGHLIEIYNSHSTVTDLAKLRGRSTLKPLSTAT